MAETVRSTVYPGHLINAIVALSKKMCTCKKKKKGKSHFVCVDGCTKRTISNDFTSVNFRIREKLVHGHGLLSAQVIEPEGVVMEYVAFLKTDEEYKADVVNEIDKKYVIRFAPGFVLDGSKYGNAAKFAHNSCQPNCRPELFFDKNELPRLFLVANKQISPNEEITYAYPTELGKGIDKMKCICGNAKCLNKLSLDRTTKRLFHCLQCKRDFCNSSTLSRHHRHSHGTGIKQIFTCDVACCRRIFYRKDHFTRHNLRKHPPEEEK